MFKPNIAVPRRIIPLSMQNIYVLRRTFVILCKTSASISVPPVEPPALATIPTPIPSKIPPKIAETVRSTLHQRTIEVISKNKDVMAVE